MFQRLKKRIKVYTKMAYTRNPDKQALLQKVLGQGGGKVNLSI